MTATTVESPAEKSGGLDISRPGSSERRTNLFVKSPPFLGDEKARELEKDGLLSGLAPPSQILDGSMPLVELEANRLQDAMAWVYESVQSLQSQSTAVEARLSGLQEALQQLNQSPIDVMLDPRGRFTSEVSRVETEAEEGSPKSPDSPSDQSSGLKRVLLQLEKKHAANEKLSEMRLDSLKHELDQRLQRKDLQDFQSQINEQLDSFLTKSRVDMGVLGSMIHSESAAERRRIQMQLDVTSKKISSQVDNWEKSLKESSEKHDAALQSIEARLQALEDLDTGSLANKINELSASLGARPISRQGYSSSAGQSNANEDTRLQYLEAAVSQLENRFESLARAGSAKPVSVQAPTGEVKSSLLEEFSLRLKQLENRFDAPLSSGGGDDVHHQLMEFHRQQSELHRQMLDVGVRLGQLEQQQLANSGSGQKDVGTGDVSQLENRLSALESGLSAAKQKAEDASKALEKNQRKSTASVESMQRTMDLFVKYIGGEVAEDEAGSPSKAENPEEWALAWLERRVAALVKDRPDTIDGRLRRLEKDNPNSPEMVDRLIKLEKEFYAVDMKDLRNVRPDLLDYQQHQELVDSDIMKEVNELKCIVGCIEACIPRETRKAVQLFKRASGSAEGRALSPREFDVESKILQLREDMQTQIQDATDTLHKGREDMTAVVKGLERKQELLDARLQSRVPVQVPFAAADLDDRSDRDDRTRLHSAATNASEDIPRVPLPSFPELAPSTSDA